MEFIKTKLIERPARTLNVDWGNSERLVVVIVSSDVAADKVIACGVDPDRPNIERPLTFDLMLPKFKIDAFLKRLADGQPFGALRDGTCDLDAVDVSTSQPPTQGPKMKAVLARAASLDIHDKLTA